MAVTSGDVSRFLRDDPRYNILLGAVQFTEEDIDAGIRFALSSFNAITPTSSYTADNFPNEYLLLLGVVAYLLQSEAFLQLRNSVTYQDGDVAVQGIDNKYAEYSNLAGSIKGEFQQMSQKVKQQINAESCYGGLGSGYRYTRPGWGWGSK